MSTVISTIETSLATYLANAITSEGDLKVYVGNPESFVSAELNTFPLILVSYKGCDPYEGMYPGALTFSIYFIESYVNRNNIYTLLSQTFTALDGKMPIAGLNSVFKMSQGDKLYFIDFDIVIFEQQYTCLEV